MRILKFFIGLALLPLCVAVSRSVYGLLLSMQPDPGGPIPSAFGWLVGGFAVWFVLFLVLPRPVRTYVFAHELTHVLWAWLFGAQVSDFQVGADGGSVAVSKSNVFITLAPYFFPLYTVLVILLYYLLQAFIDVSIYEPFWLGLIGLTWSFHFTFTLHALAHQQTDVQEHGRLFSYAVIYLMNILGIALWLIMIASPTLEDFFRISQQQCQSLHAWMVAHSATLWEKFK